MPQNRNPASRLHAFLSGLPTFKDNAQVLSAWSTAFEVNETDASKQARQVTERLVTLSKEIDLIREGMRSGNFSSHLYSKSLAAFDAALSPMNIAQTWNNVRQHLKPEHMLALQFCGEILPDEEDIVPAEDLDDIAQVVSELEALMLASDKLPLRLRRLIEHQIGVIRAALNDYALSGAKALRDALRSSYGELVEAKDIIAEHKDSPEISMLAKAWQKLNSAAEVALRADGVAQLGHRTWLFIEAVIKGSV